LNSRPGEENTLYLEIDKGLLERACKEMIETALFCLSNAYKGTIYRIGRPPELVAERITSGIMEHSTGQITWGLPTTSEYNSPGKPWSEYCDQPNRPLEAMAWCVEKQKSWTAENPSANTRSVTLQLEGKSEDFYHMEPVLVRKSDLKLDRASTFVYPKDGEGNTLWKYSPFVVVAVIKIHFHPYSITIGSHETKVIKRLSHLLGTELLSYKLQQDSLKAMEQLAQDRLNACNLLADSLRNTITKSGVIFNLVKREIGRLRDKWEEMLLQKYRGKNGKGEAIQELNEILLGMEDGNGLNRDLLNAQNTFLTLSLPPQKGENWVTKQIEMRWIELLARLPQDSQKQAVIWQTIDKLKKALYFGQKPENISKYDKIPEDAKLELVDLLYRDNDHFDASSLDRLIEILETYELDIDIPFRERSKKTLTQLKVLAETMSQLERNTNFLLHEVLNGAADEPLV
jgi:hypothetical protein